MDDLERYLANFCDPELQGVFRACRELIGPDGTIFDRALLLWYCLVQARPDLVPPDWELPLEDVLAFDRTLQAQPLGQAGLPEVEHYWELLAQSKGEPLGVTELAQDLLGSLEIALLYWQHGFFPPPFADRMDFPMRPRFDWRQPGAVTALAEWRRPMSPVVQLLEGLLEPRFQDSLQSERQEVLDALSRDTQGGKAVLTRLVEFCSQHNLIPEPAHLSWAVLTCPGLKLPLSENTMATLKEILRADVLGTLPDHGVSAAENRLQTAAQTLLDRDSTYADAERVLGRGRVGRWIPRTQGWIRVCFDQSLLVSIETKNP